MTVSQRKDSIDELPPAGIYRIVAEESSITFRTRHLFGLAPVRGRFAVRSGALTVQGGPRRLHATMAVQASSFHTGHPGRDAAVLGPRLLDASRHPDIVVTAGTGDVTTLPITINGELLVRGARHPLQVNVSGFSVAGRRVSVQVQAVVDRYAHGVAAAKGLAGRWLHLETTIVAEQTESARGTMPAGSDQHTDATSGRTS